MTDPLPALTAISEQAWLVGGALRDRLLERATADYDVVVAAPADELQRTARALGRATDASAFALSDEFGAWRLVARDRSWELDLLPLEGDTIESDLVRRDLTINAIAQRLGGDETLVDPTGGLADLAAHRLRAVAGDSFERDPLRVLRLARFACELQFDVDPDTLALARASAPRLTEVAAERVFGELRRVLTADRAIDGLDMMDAAGMTEVVLPELTALRGIEQSHFHHLDVFEHTRAVLAEAIAIERDPEPAFGAQAAAVRELLATPLANDLTRGGGLRFGALLHDIAKPQTREVTAEGRVTFMRHDEAGARMAGEILMRLRASARLAEYVSDLARHHLRLGFLVHSMPLGRREIYRYLDACSPVAADVTVLSVADRLATRGVGSERAIARHVELARELLREAQEFNENPPRPPIRGNELVAELGIRPGPELGRLLHELEEAVYAGEVSSREEAIGYARERVRRE